MVSEQPVKSLERWYNVSLKDSDQCYQLREETIQGLTTIDKTSLPGKLKLWCLQFGLLSRLMWSLMVYEVPITKVKKLEKTVSSYIFYILELTVPWEPVIAGVPSQGVVGLNQ